VVVSLKVAKDETEAGGSSYPLNSLSIYVNSNLNADRQGGVKPQSRTVYALNHFGHIMADFDYFFGKMADIRIYNHNVLTDAEIVQLYQEGRPNINTPWPTKSPTLSPTNPTMAPTLSPTNPTMAPTLSPTTPAPTIHSGSAILTHQWRMDDATDFVGGLHGTYDPSYITIGNGIANFTQSTNGISIPSIDPYVVIGDTDHRMISISMWVQLDSSASSTHSNHQQMLIWFGDYGSDYLYISTEQIRTSGRYGMYPRLYEHTECIKPNWCHFVYSTYEGSKYFGTSLVDGAHERLYLQGEMYSDYKDRFTSSGYDLGMYDDTTIGKGFIGSLADIRIYNGNILYPSDVQEIYQAGRPNTNTPWPTSSPTEATIAPTASPTIAPTHFPTFSGPPAVLTHHWRMEDLPMSNQCIDSVGDANGTLVHKANPDNERNIVFNGDSVTLEGGLGSSRYPRIDLPALNPMIGGRFSTSLWFNLATGVEGDHCCSGFPHSFDGSCCKSDGEQALLYFKDDGGDAFLVITTHEVYINSNSGDLWTAVYKVYDYEECVQAWCHLVVTIDEINKLRVFLNTNLILTHNLLSYQGNEIYPVSKMYTHSYMGVNFDGSLDDVRLYNNNTLTFDKVQTLYATGRVTTPTFPPTASPTYAPTEEPTLSPSASPSQSPSASPTETTLAPTESPSWGPTNTVLLHRWLLDTDATDSVGTADGTSNGDVSFNGEYGIFSPTNAQIVLPATNPLYVPGSVGIYSLSLWLNLNSGDESAHTSPWLHTDPYYSAWPLRSPLPYSLQHLIQYKDGSYIFEISTEQLYMKWLSGVNYIRSNVPFKIWEHDECVQSWCHVGIAINSNEEIKLTINGVLQPISPWYSSGHANNPTIPTIPDRTWDSVILGYKLKGRLDDVRIYGGVDNLSPTDMMALYNEGRPI